MWTDTVVEEHKVAECYGRAKPTEDPIYRNDYFVTRLAPISMTNDRGHRPWPKRRKLHAQRLFHLGVRSLSADISDISQ